jgi:hypothetical protein
MKKVFLFIAVMMAMSTISQAQKLHLNGYANFVFDDKTSSYYDQYHYYNAKVRGGLQLGGGLEYMADPTLGVELCYLRQDAIVPTNYQNGGYVPIYTNMNVSINFITLGANFYSSKPGSVVQGFAGPALGVCIFGVNNPGGNTPGAKSSYQTATKFAWGLKGGANIWVTKALAIKLQAELLSAVDGIGGSLYFGSGGYGVGVSTYSTMVQFGLGGGFVYEFGAK